MNSKMRKEKLAKQISLALMAGMVTYTPVAFGMPTGGISNSANIPTDMVASTRIRDGVTVNVNEMDITSVHKNNVINWQDFSIGEKEAVKFDGNNYANIVTGSATSMVNGFLEGPGDIYLINPNGVIFGEKAQVNVGNLYVSTQGKVDTGAFDGTDTAGAVISTSGTPAADIVNLGNIKATKVEVNGNNIRFLNAANIQNANGEVNSNVIVNAQGYVHVGHEGEATESDYTVKSGKKTEYQLVYNIEQLQEMNGSNNYMLADDINKNGETVSFTPIANFKGKFDGMFYTINNLSITAIDSGGMFSSTNGATLENVGLVNVNVGKSSSNATTGIGTVVGNASNTILSNVYTTGGSVIASKTGESNTGGLVGIASGNLTINTSYNNNSVMGAGILGSYSSTVTINDTYNTGELKGSVVQFGMIGTLGSKKTTLNVYNSYTSKGELATTVSDKSFHNSYGEGTLKTQAANYSGWDDILSDVGGVSVDKVTGNVTKPTWRIYAGQSLPLLTAFFKGTVQASYDYTMGSSVAGKNTDTTAEVLGITNTSGNLKAVYNGDEFKITNEVGGVTFGGDVTSVSTNSITDYSSSDVISVAPYGTTERKNAKVSSTGTDTYALFSSGQLGYDIAGSNFVIQKRIVQKSGDDTSLEVSREYQNNAVYAAGGTTTGTLTKATYENDKLTSTTGIVKQDADSVGMSGVAETFYSLDKIGKTTLADCDAWYNAATPDARKAAEDGSVGKNKYVRLTYTSGGELKGDGSENYELSSASGTSSPASSINGVITPKTLVLSKKSGLTSADKVYDGNNTLADTYKTLDNVFTIDSSGIISGDTVKLSGTTPTVYGGINAGSYDLLYSRLKIDNNNYRISYDGSIIYSGNKDFSVNPDGGTISIDGNITPRELDVSSLFQTVTKTYDNTSSANGLSLKLSDSQTGVISADSNKLKFILEDGAVFINKEKKEETNASSGLQVSGNVKVVGTTGDSTVLKNYKLTGETKTIDEVNTAAFNGSGSITKRNLDIVLGTTTGIDKEYDGTTVVSDDYKTFGGNYVQYAENSAKLVKADGYPEDGVQIKVSALYDSYGSGDDGSNVYRATDGTRTVLDKNITYTVFLTGSGKLNYTINNDASVGTGVKLTGAKGKINPIAVTTNLSNVTLEHTYNGKSTATPDELSSQITGTTAPITRADGSALPSTVKVSLDTSGAKATYYTDAARTMKASNAGEGYTVQYTGLGLAGEGNVADNYDFSAESVVTSSGKITAKKITNLSQLGQAWNAVTKVYDGTLDVYGTNEAGNKVKEDSTLAKSNILSLYDTAVTDDNDQQIYIAFQIAEAAYANKNVDADKGAIATPVAQKVTYKVKLTGDSANNFDLSGITDATVYDADSKQLTVAKDNHGTITPISVTLSKTPTGLDKVYDGTTDASEAVETLNNMINNKDITLQNVLQGESVTLSKAASATYQSENVDGGNGSSDVAKVQDVTFTGVSLSSGNYVLNGVQGKGTIKKRAVKVNITDGISKQYDGKTDAGKGYQTTDKIADYVKLIDVKTGNEITSGNTIVENDSFDATQIDADYGKMDGSNFTESADAGADKVRYASISNAILNKNNYDIQDINGSSLTNDTLIAKGVINKRKITASDIKFDLVDSITKVYDGNDAVAHTDADGTVHAASEYITGNAPYVEIEDMDGDSNKDHLNISDFTIGQAQFGHVEDGDESTFSASKNVADVNKAAYKISFGEHSLDNFEVTSGAVSALYKTTNGSITKRPVTLHAVNDTKTYDGTDESSNRNIVADNLAEGDRLSATQKFNSVNVAEASTVSVYSYGIWDATNVGMTENYSIKTEKASGTITPATIKLEFKDVSKYYDGTTAVQGAGLNTDNTKSVAEQVAVIHNGDDVSLVLPDYTNVTDAYYNLGSDVKTNTGKTNNVTYTGLKLSGAQAGNYVLANKNGEQLAGDAAAGYTAYGNGTIAQKVLNDTNLSLLFGNASKTYNNDYDFVPATGKAVKDYVTATVDSNNALVINSIAAKYVDKDASQSAEGTYDKAITYIIGVDTTNYNIDNVTGKDALEGTITRTAENAGRINKATATASVSNTALLKKVYDGTTALYENDQLLTPEELRKRITVSGLYDGDGADVTVSGAYDTKNAGGPADRVTYMVTGNQNLLKNYNLAGAVLNAKGQIDKATMSVAGVTKAIRSYDGTADTYNDNPATPIAIQLDGVNGEKLTITNEEIADVTRQFIGKYGSAGSTSDSFTEDTHVAYDGNQQPTWKGVQYTGLENAVAAWVAANGSEEQKLIPQNYTIQNTVYFDEAKEQGMIVPLAITADAVKAKWNAVTKVYDGTDTVKVKDPLTEGLYLYVHTKNGKDVPVQYEVQKATYDSGANVVEASGLTYVLKGVAGQYVGDYSMTDGDKETFVNKVYKSSEDVTDVLHMANKTPGSITPRKLYVETNSITKEYDGTTDVTNPLAGISIVEAQGKDSGIIGTDDVSLKSDMTGEYAHADVYGNDGSTTQNVTYSKLSLDGAAADNYKLVNKIGDVETDIDTSTEIVGDNKGTITPREIEVSVNATDIRKTYDGTSTVNNVTSGDGTGKLSDLEFDKAQKLVNVMGGTLSTDGSTMTYTPTAGAEVKVTLEKVSEFSKEDGTPEENASGVKELGVNYYLKWDNKNYKLVRTDGTDLINSDPVKLSATLRGENIGTIDKATLTAQVTKDAVKEYDGTTDVNNAVENITFTGLVDHDKNVNGRVSATGIYDNPNAASSEGEDVMVHQVTYELGELLSRNYELSEDSDLNGKGTITRRKITVNPGSTSSRVGEQPQFNGTLGNVVEKDRAQAEKDFVWNSPDYPAMQRTAGEYAVFGWYKGRNSGNYGNNYTFENNGQGKWTVSGSTDPLDPTNPDSPLNPENPDSPLNPKHPLNPETNPDSPLNPQSPSVTAIAQAGRFKPDEKSYSRASHDDNVEHFGRQAAISISYEEAGVNVGEQETLVSRKSVIGIESAGNVVNLGDAAMRAGNIGIEMNGANLAAEAEKNAVEAGMPVAAEETTAVAGSVAAMSTTSPSTGWHFIMEEPEESNASEGGISIITAEPEDEEKEDEKDRAALLARSDRDTHIGIETVGGGVNMAAAVR